MYNEFAKNITKESDPVRQKHYTTKKHWRPFQALCKQKKLI